MNYLLLIDIALIFPMGTAAQTDTGPVPDVEAIHLPIDRHALSVDTVDLNLLPQIWSDSPEVSFIYPLGEKHGFDAIEQHDFQLGTYIFTK